eukprot:CAMPEP_0204153596 /NCGR_PEP_ID=MMETSP0361-20130328/27985_1 /ASSEMBLY_ACC=CAM_ASM_000343 /TAXON_ID=268821 /ORGANISM="Scrippsiella Hangoei, Strain SHTV-5" /LENGTH=252 /DNA_ID=CAMNT_0051108741 /DNA_START=32 /DNA_END=791 /DNA_ORIENTATION=-
MSNCGPRAGDKMERKSARSKYQTAPAAHAQCGISELGAISGPVRAFIFPSMSPSVHVTMHALAPTDLVNAMGELKAASQQHVELSAQGPSDSYRPGVATPAEDAGSPWLGAITPDEYASRSTWQKGRPEPQHVPLKRFILADFVPSGPLAGISGSSGSSSGYDGVHHGCPFGPGSSVDRTTSSRTMSARGTDNIGACGSISTPSGLAAPPHARHSRANLTPSAPWTATWEDTMDDILAFDAAVGSGASQRRC